MRCSPFVYNLVSICQPIRKRSEYILWRHRRAALTKSSERRSQDNTRCRSSRVHLSSLCGILLLIERSGALGLVHKEAKRHRTALHCIWSVNGSDSSERKHIRVNVSGCFDQFPVHISKSGIVNYIHRFMFSLEQWLQKYNLLPGVLISETFTLLFLGALQYSNYTLAIFWVQHAVLISTVCVLWSENHILERFFVSFSLFVYLR